MSRCNTIIAAALAAAALAAPSALAQTPDIHARATPPSDRNGARPEIAGNPNISAGVDHPAQAKDDDKNAATGDDATPTAEMALAQERYYMSFGEHAAADANVTLAADPALAQERYQASYGNPTPLTNATRTVAADPGDGIARPPFVIAVLGALMVGFGAGSVLHLLRARRRRATRLAT